MKLLPKSDCITLDNPTNVKKNDQMLYNCLSFDISHRNCEKRVVPHMIVSRYGIGCSGWCTLNLLIWFPYNLTHLACFPILCHSFSNPRPEKVCKNFLITLIYYQMTCQWNITCLHTGRDLLFRSIPLSWKKRIEQLFIAVVGDETYETLLGLLAPAEPSGVVFIYIMNKLNEYYSPKHD